ncbi:adult-specific cuticular protein ACP-20-like [Diorhabda carinulata]|uniref:adult-specific cuticular protein ACP-20-like n=1 Tax=Diorhabda carinulata TaxID=1163345 RepID=UPI0025A0B1A5|nr:adult-specific cuticular protein ACP-20-like [Diorhabda carinulata]
MIAKILYLSAFLAVTQAGYLLGGHEGGQGFGYGGLSYAGGHTVAIAKEPVVEYYAPPKYDYKYGVQDYHTGDVKNQEEFRVGDLTHSDYSVSEKDRKIQVSRVVSGAVPIHGKGW